MKDINPTLHGFQLAVYIIAFAIMLLGVFNAAHEFFFVEESNELEALCWLFVGIINFDTTRRIKSDALLVAHKIATLSILKAIEDTYGKEALAKLTISICKSLSECHKMNEE